jgi:hypothetical protein
MNYLFKKAALTLAFFYSLIEYLLYAIGRNIPLALLLYVFLPIIAFAVAYWLSGSIELNGGNSLPTDMNGFLYSLYFSVATFTGMEPAKVVPKCAGLWISSLEAIVAYVNTVLGIGGIISARLSSR